MRPWVVARTWPNLDPVAGSVDVPDAEVVVDGVLDALDVAAAPHRDGGWVRRELALCRCWGVETQESRDIAHLVLIGPLWPHGWTHGAHRRELSY